MFIIHKFFDKVTLYLSKKMFNSSFLLKYRTYDYSVNKNLKTFFTLSPNVLYTSTFNHYPRTYNKKQISPK